MRKSAWYRRKIVRPGETIYELRIPKRFGFGLAIAEIRHSEPHLHERTEERYVPVDGGLVLYLGGESYPLSRDDNQLVPIGTVHWAESTDGTPARVLVITDPPWRKSDHHLAK
ncbi:MAG: cupin domain-containing protein [bacterium]|nr:cupin domain-containing protein [bacterium]